MPKIEKAAYEIAKPKEKNTFVTLSNDLQQTLTEIPNDAQMALVETQKDRLQQTPGAFWLKTGNSPRVRNRDSGPKVTKGMDVLLNAAKEVNALAGELREMNSMIAVREKTFVKSGRNPADQ